MSGRRIPIPHDDTAPLWEAARRGELLLQQCRKCAGVQYWRRPFCAACGAGNLADVSARGRGTVHSFTVVHVPPDKTLADTVPYVVAIVQLEEGPRLMTNIVDIPPDQVVIGMPVQVRFRAVSEEVSLPLFRPA